MDCKLKIAHKEVKWWDLIISTQEMCISVSGSTRVSSLGPSCYVSGIFWLQAGKAFPPFAWQYLAVSCSLLKQYFPLCSFKSLLSLLRLALFGHQDTEKVVRIMKSKRVVKCKYLKWNSNCRFNWQLIAAIWAIYMLQFSKGIIGAVRRRTICFICWNYNGSCRDCKGGKMTQLNRIKCRLSEKYKVKQLICDEKMNFVFT